MPSPLVATEKVAVTHSFAVTLDGWRVILSFARTVSVAAELVARLPFRSVTTQRNFLPFRPAVALTLSVAVLQPVAEVFCHVEAPRAWYCHW